MIKKAKRELRILERRRPLPRSVLNILVERVNLACVGGSNTCTPLHDSSWNDSWAVSPIFLCQNQDPPSLLASFKC
jgi:hypothetical protein